MRGMPRARRSSSTLVGDSPRPDWSGIRTADAQRLDLGPVAGMPVCLVGVNARPPRLVGVESWRSVDRALGDAVACQHAPVLGPVTADAVPDRSRLPLVGTISRFALAGERTTQTPRVAHGRHPNKQGVQTAGADTTSSSSCAAFWQGTPPCSSNSGHSQRGASVRGTFWTSKPVVDLDRERPSASVIVSLPVVALGPIEDACVDSLGPLAQPEQAPERLRRPPAHAVAHPLAG